MRRSNLLLAAAALACGSSSTGRERAVPRDDSGPCQAGPTAECLAERARACRAAGGRAHRLTYDTLPPLTIGPGGLVRVDHLGGRLIGVDSTRWMACFDQCPEGAAARICFPLAVPLQLSWTAAAAGCQRTERDGEPWQGRPTRTVDVVCPDGASTVRFVPGLDPVRRDLVTAGAIDGSDLLATLDGLAVEMRAGESVHASLTAVGEAGCDAFVPPAGYRIMGGADQVRELERAAAEPAAALAAEVEKIRAAVSVQAVARAKADLLPRFRSEKGEACRARGFDPADDARLEACAAASPETEAPFRAAVSRETSRLLAEQRAEVDALTRRLLVAPICRHYAESQ